MSSYHSQEQTLAQLPAPSAAEISHSAELIDFIVGKIQQSDGVIPFSDYMNYLLYTPGFGYYSAGLSKFGQTGDFVTAPEISPLFGRTLAKQCLQLFEQGCVARILEFGAGSGKLCEQILGRIGSPVDYYILELSANLRERQQNYLKQKLDFKTFEKISWLERLPVDFSGVVLANEVLDAMPVSLVKKNEQWHELGVGFDGAGFCWRDCSSEGEAVAAIQSIEAEVGVLPPGYQTEVNLNYGPWLKALSESSDQVMVMLIDYGYERASYYHAERTRGTLLCHYHHRVHDDALVLPGLQDVTASVDFDAVADAAIAAGFEIAGLVSQAHFLLKNGLLDEINYGRSTADTFAEMATAQQIKTLTLPGEMGDRFKVLGLTKNIEPDLPAFVSRR